MDRHTQPTVTEYWERMEVAEEAATRAYDLNDIDTGNCWAKTYHGLADKCLAAHQVELRPEPFTR